MALTVPVISTFVRRAAGIGVAGDETAVSVVSAVAVVVTLELGSDESSLTRAKAWPEDPKSSAPETLAVRAITLRYCEGFIVLLLYLHLRINPSTQYVARAKEK
jgi:hypothetical protein